MCYLKFEEFCGEENTPKGVGTGRLSTEIFPFSLSLPPSRVLTAFIAAPPALPPLSFSCMKYFVVCSSFPYFFSSSFPSLSSRSHFVHCFTPLSSLDIPEGITKYFKFPFLFLYLVHSLLLLSPFFFLPSSPIRSTFYPIFLPTLYSHIYSLLPALHLLLIHYIAFSFPFIRSLVSTSFIAIHATSFHSLISLTHHFTLTHSPLHLILLLAFLSPISFSLVSLVISLTI